ncbi:MAG: HAMP domain-containing histidine kinase [Bifidobacteriaceae bacterium]|jgi:signal transduction histidine kinase|nr:HAMP domain-containing histidine kinase [Bifidobacteriaceae bacterium]
MVATSWAVAVAVFLLGLPLGFFASQLATAEAEAEVQRRADSLASALDSYESAHLPVTQGMVDSYLSQDASQLPAHIQVELADGHVITAGAAILGPVVVLEASPLTATDVRFEVSWSQMNLRALPAVGIVLALCLVAMAAGMALAAGQARRISAPLVYLAASAEQLGAGQLRIDAPKAGIEEIDLVAEELSRSGERMAKRLATERQFASDASHQLRTPLTALSMRLEEIEYVSTEAGVQEEARIALEQIERLSTTIDELLGRTKTPGAGAPRRLLRLSEVFHQQQEEWQPVFAQAGRTLVTSVDESLSVVASPGSLAQVIATLLENSVTHGDGVTILRGREVQGGVAVEVADEGPGVSEELAPRIFEREFSAGGSTGLGLALARDLMAADGGRLELSQRRPPVFTVFLSAVS